MSLVSAQYNGSSVVASAISDPRLTTDNMFNKSTLPGMSLTDVLNGLTGSLVPSTFTGLAEQDLLSYNASTQRWNNRTVANALKGVGTNSIAIGPSAVALVTNGVAIGNGATAQSANGNSSGVAIGYQAVAGGLAVAIGYQATVNNGLGYGNTAVGNYTIANGGTDNSVFGNGAQTSTASYCTALGAFSYASAANATAVGRGAYAITSNCAAFGYGALAAGTNTVSVGTLAGTSNTGANNIFIGASCTGSAAARTGCIAIGHGCVAGTDNTLKIALNNNTVTFQSTLVPDPTTRSTTATYLPVSFNGGSTIYYIPLLT